MRMTGGKWREGTLRQNDGSVAILDEHNARICRVDAGPGSTHAQAISQLPALVALVRDLRTYIELQHVSATGDALRDRVTALLRAMGEG